MTAAPLRPDAAAGVVPHGRAAAMPPEARGVDRDGVRMLVASPGCVEHRVVRDLPRVLSAGDLLVVNTSATLPAAVDVRRHGVATTVHVSTQLDDGHWVVEVRRPDNDGPARVEPGEVLRLPGGQRLRLLTPYPRHDQTRLWRALPIPVIRSADYLARHGRPIRYPYLSGEWPLASFQTIFATHPGSAEMPSAGRPLTEAVLLGLATKGIPVVPVALHTGVSSLESHEPPQPELYTVPEVTARLVNSTRAAGRRVVAVGTTVVRALESVADNRGRVHAATGWTDLVLGSQRPARVVAGLLTGLHDPQASHLDLLEAVVGADLVRDSYRAATADGSDGGYLWHEFGDTMLLLAPPALSGRSAGGLGLRLVPREEGGAPSRRATPGGRSSKVLGRRRRAAAADRAARDAAVPGQDPADDATSPSFQLAENTAAYPSTHSDHPGYQILFSYRGGGEVTVLTPARPVEASPVFWVIDLPVAQWTPLADPDGQPIPVELWFESGLVRARWV